MTLKQQLDEFWNRFAQFGNPAVVKVIKTHIKGMVDRGIAELALKPGSTAPDFSLPNALGRPVALADLLAKGPVVLAFYRGAWCPFCDMQLHAYQQILPQIQALGATLVAVSPQDADHSLSQAEKLALQFEVLTDKGNTIASQYGLVFSVEQPVRDVYHQLGFPLPAFNADDTWSLPVPGVFIIDPSGAIRLSWADADFTHRMEPAELLAGLKRVVAQAA